MKYKNTLTIKHWSEEDRPREKLLLKGKSTLSDAELIAILISSGSTELTAVELSKLILSKVNNNLNELAKLGIQDLLKFKGIGEAKAVSIISALELGRRRKDVDKTQVIKIDTPQRTYNYIKPYLLDLKHEEFWILLTNRNNVLIKHFQISIGGVSGTFVDKKIIFKHAIENLASMIVLIHNHPSGNLKPSEIDLRLTKDIVETGKLIDIPIVEHLIFTDTEYYSFAENNLI